MKVLHGVVLALVLWTLLSDVIYLMRNKRFTAAGSEFIIFLFLMVFAINEIYLAVR
jgi:hypothetical protein